MKRAGQDSVPVSESDQIISQFKAVFRRRKLLILSCAALCLGPIAAYNEVVPPTYESYVTLIMDEFVGPSASFNPERSQDVRTSNRLQELSSYSFADEVARA